MKVLLRLSAVLTLVIHSTISFSQTERYIPLKSALKNTSATSVSFFAEDNDIPEFISRSSEFKSLKSIKLSRPSNSVQSRLILATLSTFTELEILHLALASFDSIPPYLDQFESIQLLRISHAQTNTPDIESTRFILKNGKQKAVLEIVSDQETAMDFMDRFFEKYPQMISNINDFELYEYRNDLTRVPRNYQSFKPMWLPQASSAKINPYMASKIITREGSVISIPPNAFVSRSGEIISDSVQVDFTYIKDQIDMAFAQIGMETKIDGEGYLLESAGMFEINATVNGAFLSLAAGKTIEVDMVSGTGGAFNVYDFDDQNNTWNLESNGNLPSENDAKFSPAFFEYNRLYTKGNITRSPDDLYPYGSQFFDSPEYIRFHHRENTFWEKVDRENKSEVKQVLSEYKRSARYKRSKLSYLLLERSKSPEKALRPHQFFTLNELNDEFPEIKSIKKTLWYTQEPISYGAFKSAFGKNRAYCDFRLSYDEGQQVFQFIFKDAVGVFDTLTAIPYPENQKQKDAKAQFHNDVLSAYEKSFRSYTQKISRSAASSERRYSKSYSAQIAKQKKREERAWEKVKPLMSIAEFEMTFDEWFAHFDKMSRLYSQTVLANGGTSNLVRALNIDKLGYWNCDNPMFKRARFKTARVLASKSDQVRSVSALFLSFNSAYTSISIEKTKIDIKGDCAYILFSDDKVSWITPREVNQVRDKKLKVERDFIAVENLDIEELRQELLSKT